MAAALVNEPDQPLVEASEACKEKYFKERTFPRSLNASSPPAPAEEINWILKSISNTKKVFMQFLKKDGEYFHSIFKQLPSTELPIDDFSCAIQREILVHGRLYVSPNYFSFYSNIFGWETILTIPWIDVIAIRKERVAFLIPNAIEIGTIKENYFFASFATRDVAYRCMCAVWQNAQRGPTFQLPMERLRETYTKEWRGSACHGLLELADILPTKSASEISRSLDCGAQDAIDESEHYYSPCGSPLPTVANSESSAIQQLDGPVICGCTSHYGRVIREDIFPCCVNDLCELNISEWSVEPRPQRNLTYVLALNYSIGPKSARAFDTQWDLHCRDGISRVIEGEVRTPSVPYGENFHTFSRYCVTRVTRSSCKVMVTCEVRYRKGVPWAFTKNLIERNTFDGVQNYVDHVFGNLRKHLGCHSIREEQENRVTAGSMSSALAISSVVDANGTDTGTMETDPVVEKADGLLVVADNFGVNSDNDGFLHETVAPDQIGTARPWPVRAKTWLVVLLLVINIVLVARICWIETTVQPLSSDVAIEVQHLIESTPPGSCVSWVNLLSRQQSAFDAERAQLLSRAREAKMMLEQARDFFLLNDQL